MKRLLILAAFLLFSHGAWAQLALDGHASGTSVSSSTVATSTTLTTTNATDVIIALVTSITTGAGPPNVSSISGCSLSWTKRFSRGNTLLATPDHGNADIWYATTSGTISSCTVTANLSSTNADRSADITVFGISGANTSTPFDTNVALTGSSSSTSTSSTPRVFSGLSTNNANDFVFAVTTANTTSGNPGAGYTTIDVAHVTAGHQDNQYQIFSSTQSGVTVTFGSADQGNGYVILIDAVQQAGGPPPPSGNFVFVAAPVP